MEARRSERGSTAAAFAGFFFLLAAISILRPVRDQAGIARGVDALPWMFTATFLGVVAGALLVAWMAARVPRSLYLPLAYRVFAAGLMVIWLPLLRGAAPAGIALFVWSSICSLLAVSLYWGLLTDVFGRPEAMRVFGMIAAGATAGTLAGPLLVQWAARPLGPANLLPVAAVLLELSAQMAAVLRRQVESGTSSAPPRPSVRDALVHLFQSSRLRRLSGYVLFLTATATFLYFEQARIIAGTSTDAGERTVLFARMDLLASATTLALQAFVARPLLESAGIRTALALLPVVTAAGFVAFAQIPSLVVLAVVQGVRKAAHFGLERPGREALLTALQRDQKYAPKAFVDGVVYRGGDAVTAWALQALPLSALIPAALALCSAWLVNSLLLAQDAQAGKGSLQ